MLFIDLNVDLNELKVYEINENDEIKIPLYLHTFIFTVTPLLIMLVNERSWRN